jgi:hypothetical protein
MLYSKLAQLSLVGAVCLGLAAPAMAQAPNPLSLPSHAPNSRHSDILRPGRLSVSGAVTSPYLGGYAGTPTEGFAAVSTTFKVPAYTCTSSSGYELAFFGNILSPSGTTGYEEGVGAYAYALEECANGTPYLVADASASSNQTQIFPTAGDTLLTRIAETSSGTTVASVTDLTTGQTASDSGPATTDAEYQIGAYVNYSYPLPQFGKVTFKNASVNGQYLSQDSSATRYNLAQHLTNEVVPSKLSTTRPSNSFIDTEKATS